MRLCRYFKKGFPFLAFGLKFWRGLTTIKAGRNNCLEGLKIALFALICTRFLLQVITAGFQDVSGGPDQRGKGPEQRRVQFRAKAGTTGVKRGHNYNKSGGGGIQPKRQGQGSPQKNLGTILAKPFPIPKCFGSQKISAKISGKTKRGLYLLVEFLEG